MELAMGYNMADEDEDEDDDEDGDEDEDEAECSGEEGDVQGAE